MRNKSNSQAEPGQDVDQNRPWLLPYNRRLRHLQSISVRNLTSSVPSNRRLSAALDDEALPQSLSTPAKLFFKQEHRIEQSRSSTDLTSIHEQLPKSNAKSEDKENGRPDATAVATPLKRPSAKRLRRRSTLDWVNASPIARQKRLEKITHARLMDVFYTLHLDDQEPVEVSEVAHQTMNPTFRRLTSFHGEPIPMDAGSMTLKLWIKLDVNSAFECLMELHIKLGSLQYLGSALEDLKRPLPANCVLFHMTDGIFVAADDSIILPPPSIRSTRPAGASKPVYTSSYDTLMRLSNLNVSVRDALSTRRRLEEEINDLLYSHHDDLENVQSVGIVEDNLVTVSQAVTAERRRLEIVAKRRNQLRINIDNRKSFMQTERETMLVESRRIQQDKQHIEAMREALVQTDKDIRKQRRRICEDLQRIYPIEPIPSQSLAFTIRNLHLPNSVFDNSDDAVIAAALGYSCQLIHYLSFYLAAPLPYPPSPRGSSSTITDPISATPMNASSAVYPLYPRGAPRFRFEYAVFLLNKDVQLLAARASLRLVDIRHTLPNLKYLLCVASANSTKTEVAQSVNGMRTFLREASALRHVS